MLRLIPILLAVCAVSFAGEPPSAPPEPPAATLAKFNDPPAPKEFPRAGILVDTQALADKIKLAAPALVIIDARGRDAYDDGHIPDARSMVSDQLQDSKAAPYFLPSAEALKALCAAAGINAASDVVIYDTDDGRLAARVWFTLHAFGHDRVAILDGGAGKWLAEKRDWLAETPPVKPGTFVPAEKLRGACGFSELAQFRTRVHVIGKLPPTTLIDARTTAEYMGDDVRTKTGGHIPGAANIEWISLLTPVPAKPAVKDKNKEAAEPAFRVWRSAPEIHAILRLAGIEKEQKIAVYDQAGGRSSHLYFTLYLMGFDNAFNYTGGWREYGNRDDVEIEK